MAWLYLSLLKHAETKPRLANAALQFLASLLPRHFCCDHHHIACGDLPHVTHVVPGIFSRFGSLLDHFWITRCFWTRRRLLRCDRQFGHLDHVILVTNCDRTFWTCSICSTYSKRANLGSKVYGTASQDYQDYGSYDCSAGIQNWRMLGQKLWLRPQCARTWTLAVLSFLWFLYVSVRSICWWQPRAGWSDSKKQFCCNHYTLGCEASGASHQNRIKSESVGIVVPLSRPEFPCISM